MPRYFVLRETEDDGHFGLNRTRESREILSQIPGAHAKMCHIACGTSTRECCGKKIVWNAFEVTSERNLDTELGTLKPQGFRFFVLEDSEPEEELRHAAMAYFGRTAE